ncbi:MAG: 4'-phosphopantetheinyl transferase superfamily protein [Synergistales bacterium]
MMKNRCPEAWVLPGLSVAVRVGMASVSEILAALNTDLLSRQELERASRYRRMEDARRFMASRLFLRELLGRHLGLASAEILFIAGEGGKLSADLPPGFPPVLFSLSRSGDFCAVAMSGCAEVGVDIERVDFGLNWEPAAKAWLSGGENLALRSRKEESSRRVAFFRLWCAREAVSKVLGRGLALDSREGSLEELLHGQPIEAVFAGRKISVCEPEAPAGYRLAVAASGV